MSQSGLHITTNFHTIRRWIIARGGVPSKVVARKRAYPTVAFKEFAHKHAIPMSWPEFFALMMKHDFAFMYEADHENSTKGLFFKFVPREHYLDDLREEEEREDKSLWSDLKKVFS
jgi:hypothetical protein